MKSQCFDFYLNAKPIFTALQNRAYYLIKYKQLTCSQIPLPDLMMETYV